MDSILPENVEVLDQIEETSVKSEPSEVGDELRPMSANLNGKLTLRIRVHILKKIQNAEPSPSVLLLLMLSFWFWYYTTKTSQNYSKRIF